MNKDQHTPGPWTVNTALTRTGEVEVVGPSNGISSELIAVMAGPLPHHGAYPHAVANARLIAKAPEMLDFLKEAIRLEPSPGTSAIYDGDALRKLASKARALRREIEGEPMKTGCSCGWPASGWTQS